MLAITSISHTYRQRKGAEVRALDGVSVTARSGEITAIVGPNGGGKSTLFRIVTGALRPDAGSVTFNGEKLRASELGVVFQSPSLDSSLTAFENLEHHALLFGFRLRRADVLESSLSVLGIDDVLDTRVEELSGGFQRRVELAKALLSKPRLLVLDEPFSGLDTQVRGDFFSALRSLTALREITVLLITHELDIAAQCDRVAVLREGRVLADDAPAALLETCGRTVVEIRSADPVGLSRRLMAAGIPVLRPAGDALLLPDADLRVVLDVLGPDARDAVMESRRPTLDDWFLLGNGKMAVQQHEVLAA